MSKIVFDLFKENFYEKYEEDKLVEYAFIRGDHIFHIKDEKLKEKFDKKQITEFLFERYRDTTSELSNIDLSYMNTRSAPQLKIHLGGIKLPYIVYMTMNYGLLNTLNYHKIEYNIDTSRDKSANTISVPATVNEKKLYLNVKYKNYREETICNGLMPFRNKNMIIESFNDRTIFNDFIIKTGGPRAIQVLELMDQKLIDPYTEEILKLKNHSHVLQDLLLKDMPDMLFTEGKINISDISTQRIRLNEQIFALSYKQLNAAVNDLKKRKNDKNAKLYLNPDHVLNQLIGAGSLRLGNLTNPIDEIKLSTQITLRGPLAAPKRALIMSSRDVHETYVGNIASETSEYCTRDVIIEVYENSATLESDDGKLIPVKLTDLLLVKDIGFTKIYEIDLCGKTVFINETPISIKKVILPEPEALFINDFVNKFIDGDEEVVELEDDVIFVKSIDGDKECLVPISGVYKGKAETYNIKLANDRILTVSGETPIYVYDSKTDEERWIPVKEVKEDIKRYKHVFFTKTQY